MRTSHYLLIVSLAFVLAGCSAPKEEEGPVPTLATIDNNDPRAALDPQKDGVGPGSSSGAIPNDPRFNGMPKAPRNKK